MRRISADKKLISAIIRQLVSADIRGLSNLVQWRQDGADHARRRRVVRFAGQVVMVTGAAGGIGGACALRFAQEQARVACLDIDAAGNEAMAAACRELGADAFAVTCDVTQAGDGRSGAGRRAGALGGKSMSWWRQRGSTRATRWQLSRSNSGSAPSPST
jgi:hypothetical protein